MAPGGVPHRAPQVCQANEVCVAVGADTVFYYGPDFRSRYRLFYLLFSRPAAVQRERALAFAQHPLLRHVYARPRRTNLYLYAAEHGDNADLLRFSRQFYNGVLSRGGRSADDAAAAAAAQRGRVEALRQEAERYRRCYEAERLLRIERDQEHQREVEELRR